MKRESSFILDKVPFCLSNIAYHTSIHAPGFRQLRQQTLNLIPIFPFEDLDSKDLPKKKKSKRPNNGRKFQVPNDTYNTRYPITTKKQNIQKHLKTRKNKNKTKQPPSRKQSPRYRSIILGRLPHIQNQELEYAHNFSLNSPKETQLNSKPLPNQKHT
jgi:hypothetical protein